MNYFIGIDVQTARGCPFAILDEAGTVVEDGWVEKAHPDRVVATLRKVLERQNPAQNALALAIDAPRVPLAAPREWYWQGKRWRRCQAKDQGAGRHCEVVIAAHRLANPQWTPSRPPFPSWMELGFAMFRQLAPQFHLYEVIGNCETENKRTQTIPP